MGAGVDPGVLVLNRVRSHPAWTVEMVGSQPGRKNRKVRHPVDEATRAQHSMFRVVWEFGLASIMTLIAGVILEISGAELAGRANVNLVLFGQRSCLWQRRCQRSVRGSMRCDWATTDWLWETFSVTTHFNCLCSYWRISCR
jgi:hypothetical protein